MTLLLWIGRGEWHTITSLSSECELDGVPSYTTEGVYDQLRGTEAVLHPKSDMFSDPLWCHREPALYKTYSEVSDAQGTDWKTFCISSIVKLDEEKLARPFRPTEKDLVWLKNPILPQNPNYYPSSHQVLALLLIAYYHFLASLGMCSAENVLWLKKENKTKDQEKNFNKWAKFLSECC